MKLSTLLYKVLGLAVLASMFLLPLHGCGSSEAVTDTTLTAEQQSIRNELFHSADAKLEHLKSIQADVLSPGYFSTGMEHYERAERLLLQERGIDQIRSELRQAVASFEQAEETAVLGEVTFRTAMQARSDALDARAPVFSPDNWSSAESEFRTAAEFLEAGNVNRAREQARGAETRYRAVELEAIKANYLNSARETLREAESEQAQRNAPKTFAQARAEIENVEQMLSEDRYGTEEAGRMAEQADYRASYALYLHREIAAMRRENKTFEDVFLEMEAPLTKVANALDVDVRFDAGFDQPAEKIVQALDERISDKESQLATAQQLIQNLRNEKDELSDQNRRKQNEIDALRLEIDQTGDLAALLEVQRKREEAIQNVRDLIPPTDGDVFLDGNNILIRLHGLTFPVGQSTIEPAYFGLLRRLQDAIRLFPESNIRIEGHTDSRGSRELNMRLSDERAEAVSEYIRANIGRDLNMTATGFGPERPVASNDTEVGRAQNRRIDVVITPEWARQ